MEVSSQFLTPAALPRYPLSRRLGEPHGLTRRDGEEKNSLLTSGWNPGRPTTNVVSKLTTEWNAWRRFWSETPERNGYLLDLGVEMREILKLISEKYGGRL